MSIQHCTYCDKQIDTDFDLEHFNVKNKEYECVEEEYYKQTMKDIEKLGDEL